MAGGGAGGGCAGLRRSRCPRSRPLPGRGALPAGCGTGGPRGRDAPGAGARAGVRGGFGPVHQVKWPVVAVSAQQHVNPNEVSRPEEGLDVRTYQPKSADVQRTWHVIDATDVVLGRLATQVAVLLRGKHKVYFAPHIDTGDFVVVINAEKVVLTGTKSEKVVYHHHSGFPGGLKTRTFADMLATRPQQIVEKAVKGM